jgi:hypothetical protein
MCHSNTVLDLGILSILGAVNGLLLIRVVTEDNAQLLKDVEINHPEVIILSQESKIVRSSIYRSLLAVDPAVRLLTICTESNHVCINQKQIVQIQEAADIINLILDQATPTQDYLEKG